MLAILGKAVPFTPTHIHLKSKGVYQLLLVAEREIDLVPLAIYVNPEGRVWARPLDEFNDGRFKEL